MRLAAPELTFNGRYYLFQNGLLHEAFGSRFSFGHATALGIPIKFQKTPASSFRFSAPLHVLQELGMRLLFQLHRLAQHVQIEHQSLRLTDQFNQD
jgi:hypothetical protein